MKLREDPVLTLAKYIYENRKVVVITGAGLSAASGVPTFRGEDPNSIWVRRATSLGTKKAFLKDPLDWYNNFWLPLFNHSYTRATPNAGHEALARLANISANLLVVNQNIDMLCQQTQEKWDTEHQLVEIHGRLGLYHCTSDDGECNLATETHASAVDVFGPKVASQIEAEAPSGAASAPPPVTLTHVPKCPECNICPIMPLALMFDEDYQSHAFYQSDKALTAFEEAEALVFVGTSFQVNITNLAMNEGPRKRGVPVFNFNLHHSLAKTGGRSYEVHNIIGPSETTLQELVAHVEGLMVDNKAKKPRVVAPAVEIASASPAPEQQGGHDHDHGASLAPSASSSSSSSDPSYAYDTLPQPPLGRPLAEDEVEIDFQPCYGRVSHPDATVEADIDRIWAELATQRQGNGCSALFNAAKFRLAHCHMVTKGGEGEGEGKLVLQTWLTDYKTARGTNYHPDVLRLMEQGRQNHGDSGAYLSQKVGVSAVVCTTDQDVILIKRSTTGVVDFEGFYDTPGGHPEPSNVNLVFPPTPTAAALHTTDRDQNHQAALVRHEIFHSAAQEVVDEVGVSLDQLGPPLLLGIVRQLDFGGTPSASFVIPCQSSTADVRACYAAGPKEQAESTALVFVPKDDLQQFLKTTVKLTPAARASLSLFCALPCAALN